MPFMHDHSPEDRLTAIETELAQQRTRRVAVREMVERLSALEETWDAPAPDAGPDTPRTVLLALRGMVALVSMRQRAIAETLARHGAQLEALQQTLDAITALLERGTGH